MSKVTIPFELKGAAAAVVRGMALAFFACAYADQADEAEEPLRGEIMNQLPSETDPAAEEAAHKLVMRLIEGFDWSDYQDLTDLQRFNLIMMRASNAAASEENEHTYRAFSFELFGHYCAMQAMGTGVGLESFGSAVREAIPVPYLEFGSADLSETYFEPLNDPE